MNNEDDDDFDLKELIRDCLGDFQNEEDGVDAMLDHLSLNDFLGQE